MCQKSQIRTGRFGGLQPDDFRIQLGAAWKKENLSDVLGLFLDWETRSHIRKRLNCDFHFSFASDPGARRVQYTAFLNFHNLKSLNGGSDGTRTRGLLRDRQAF